jgi:hypothetical protein
MYKLKKKIRELSNRNKLLKLLYLNISIIYVSLASILNDKLYSKIKYFSNTGKKLKLENPKTFNEKLWWLKLNNRDPLLTKCTDKVLVREYIKELGFSEILNNIYGIYEKPEDINFSEIPDKSFIKTNHGSGGNFIYNKSNFNKFKFISDFNKNLGRNYYLNSREWNYKNINPLILIEENLNPNNSSILVDYRFLCFDGVVKYIFADINTASFDGTHNPSAKRNVYDLNFNLLPIKAHRENFDSSLITKPKNFESMLKYAQELSKPFVFSRIDLYNIEGKIIFGEITFYHGGATQTIYPVELELTLGNLIDINSSKIVRIINK